MKNINIKVIIIILSELLIKYSGLSNLNSVAFITFPIMTFVTLYLLIVIKFKHR